MAEPGPTRLDRDSRAATKPGAIADVVRELLAAAAWREILVIDDGSTDDTAREAAAAGARVVRHPYNKGNGAAVKTGIRTATGEYILIIDGDGQHQPADALRLTARLGEYDLVVGARSKETQAGSTRRARQRRAQPAGQLPDRARDSGSDVRVPRRAARVPARVPAAAAERLLDADDDDARVSQGRLQRRLRADRGAGRASARRRSGCRATARSSS